MEQKTDVLKTGTSTLGIVCTDGIVIAADRRATMGGMIIQKNANKIVAISDDVIITTAGNVSDAQLLAKLIKAEMKLKKFKANRDMNVKEVANLLGGMIYGNIRRMSLIPGVTHFVLAGKDSEGTHLYDLFADGSVTEIDDYVSSGSGSIFAFGVLETLYTPKLTVAEGIKVALKSMNAALQRDTASGNGIDIFSVTKDGVKKVMEKDLTFKIE